MTTGGEWFLDTNVLIAASAPARGAHAQAVGLFAEAARTGRVLCTSAQVLREYACVASRPLTGNGLGLDQQKVRENLEQLGARLRCLEEGRSVRLAWLTLLREVPLAGRQVHDANIAATMIAHGVHQLVTSNVADFLRFQPRISVVALG